MTLLEDGLQKIRIGVKLFIDENLAGGVYNKLRLPRGQ